MLRAVGLATLGLLSPVAARADWYSASTRHFVVISDDQPAALTAMATELEQYDLAMRAFRKIPDSDVSPANRVTVYVLRDVDAVSNMVQGAAGFYIPRISYSVAFTPRRAAYRDGSRLRAEPRVRTH